MEDLTKYLHKIRLELEKEDLNINIQIVMEEICHIATNNWIENGIPNLTKEQYNKVILRALTRNTTLN